MTRLAVLGGGSAFSAALLRALASQPPPADGDQVALWGGDPDALRLLAAHGTALLAGSGGQVTAHDDLVAALDGAEAVVHQVRYGRLAGRAAAERVARRSGLPPDETLGPGGLLAALFAAAGLRPVATALRDRAPGALVVMMTNPLSVSTSLLSAWGMDVVGSCELPELTARFAYTTAGSAYVPDGWHCTGLNHRGFIHRLEADGQDLLPALADGLAGRGDHATAADVAELGAVPTKYFGLVRGRWSDVPDRAAALAALRIRILSELEAEPAVSPPSLAERPTPWYDVALVPLLRARSSTTARRLVLTVADPDGLAREQSCLVSGQGIRRVAAPPPPPEVQRWLERFEDHERAVLAAMRSPSLRTVRTALAADPCVPPGTEASCASDVLTALGA